MHSKVRPPAENSPYSSHQCCKWLCQGEQDSAELLYLGAEKIKHDQKSKINSNRKDRLVEVNEETKKYLY